MSEVPRNDDKKSVRLETRNGLFFSSLLVYSLLCVECMYVLKPPNSSSSQLILSHTLPQQEENGTEHCIGTNQTICTFLTQDTIVGGCWLKIYCQILHDIVIRHRTSIPLYPFYFPFLLQAKEGGNPNAIPISGRRRRREKNV